MAHVHHFQYGWVHPVMAFALAFLGSLLGLSCTARAQQAADVRRRVRWLVLGACAIGGFAIWLLHFMAMLRFDVPTSMVRYRPDLTALSMLIAIVTVAVGLFVYGLGRPTVPRLLAGGMFTGLGVAAMHYAGMAAVQITGQIRYDGSLVAASVGIAVAAATVALWFAGSIRRDGHVVIAAMIMACAIWGMHYTGMASVRVQLDQSVTNVAGATSVQLMLPIWVVTSVALVLALPLGLSALTQEEMAGEVPRLRWPPARGKQPASPQPRPQPGTAPRQESNLRHPGSEPGALSRELRGQRWVREESNLHA
jgi:NO-binding membrane sensor protein with MHYT domain